MRTGRLSVVDQEASGGLQSYQCPFASSISQVSGLTMARPVEQPQISSEIVALGHVIQLFSRKNPNVLSAAIYPLVVQVVKEYLSPPNPTQSYPLEEWDTNDHLFEAACNDSRTGLAPYSVQGSGLACAGPVPFAPSAWRRWPRTSYRKRNPGICLRRRPRGSRQRDSYANRSD